MALRRMASLAKVDGSNFTYQPKDNIRYILDKALPAGYVSYYEVYPDTTSVEFKGFPFIIMPGLDLPYESDNMLLRRGQMYHSSLVCTLVHDRTKLADNKFRTIKQKITEACQSLSNAELLSRNGVHQVNIDWDAPSTVSQRYDSVDVQMNDFTIAFDFEVQYGN